LKGKVNKYFGTIMVINKSSHKKTKIVSVMIYKGKFKVLSELVPGENDLVLRTDSSELSFKLIYNPSCHLKRQGKRGGASCN